MRKRRRSSATGENQLGAQRSEGAIDRLAAQRTDALLERLGREWTAVSDVDRRHGADHVLVGPGGVFLVMSRKPAGPAVSVRDGVLWLRTGRDPRSDRPGVAINRHVLDAARILRRDIRSRTGKAPAVHPVVVLWCEFPQAVVESRQIAFVHGRDLLSWLSSRTPQLNDSGRREVLQAINAIPRASRRAVRAWFPHRAA